MNTKRLGRVEQRAHVIAEFMRRELANGPVLARDLHYRWITLPEPKRTGHGHDDIAGTAFAMARRIVGARTRWSEALGGFSTELVPLATREEV